MTDLLDELQSTVPVSPEMPENMEELALLSTVSRVAQNVDAIGAAIQNLAQRMVIVEDVLETILMANPEIRQKTEQLVNKAQEKAQEVKENTQE